jgi:hypothetical protein
MLNYWFFPRPKRKLNSIPEVLATVSMATLKAVWSGDRDRHLMLEESLEKDGLKREGSRRDQTGGGARTYLAWLKCLGLMFEEKTTKRIYPTIAGEEILNGANPVDILTQQVLKYQFPSSYSLSRSVNVSERFRVHPFIFVLRLLRDDRIGELTQEEIAKVVIVQGENNSNPCYEKVVRQILEFRHKGDASLEADFLVKYAQSKGGRENDPYGHLNEVANTMINWLDYTRLISREQSTIFIPGYKREYVDDIIANQPKLIDRPEEHEIFQRRYGLIQGKKKDSRNLIETATITSNIVEEARIKRAIIAESLKTPITAISPALINVIENLTGCNPKIIEATLYKMYKGGTSGALDTFLTGYREMAFASREQASEFEKSTKEIMEKIFGYKAKHVGPIGLTPDVLVISDSEGYQGIFDNKAYARYSINNDHHNRMVQNYIKGISRYNDGCEYPLNFFSYIAGGFKSTIDEQLSLITQETSIQGSAITVDNFIHLIKEQQHNPKTHADLNRIFSIGREVRITDI